MNKRVIIQVVSCQKANVMDREIRGDILCLLIVPNTCLHDRRHCEGFYYTKILIKKEYGIG